MTHIDVLFNTTKSHYFRLKLTSKNKKHTHIQAHRLQLQSQILHKHSHEGFKKMSMVYISELHYECRWGEVV